MAENEKKEIKKSEKINKFDIKITSLDIDKAEYKQIVLSNSNFPDRDYFK